VEGAFAAERSLAAHGLDRARRDLVAEAISLHMNVRVPAALGVEAHLLHAGAALDVVGARIHEVAAATRDGVLRAHPRLEMKRHIAAAMERESGARPGSRTAVLCRLGFISMIRRAPFEGKESPSAAGRAAGP
jgi:hypothetical protein